MQLIRTEDAVGSVLCHDITQIIPGVVKDAVFRKGHVVTEEDVPVLLSVGKEHLYVWEKQEGMLHENDAAEVLRQVCQGEHMNASEAKEGKIELTAQCDGLLKINREKLNQVNALGQIVLASRHGNFPVKKGDKIVGMRVVPLVIEEEKMNHVKELCGEEPIFTILPFHQMKVGIVTTGSEVYHGRITDKFTPVVKAKLEEAGMEVLGNVLCDDDSQMVTDAISEWIAKGAEFVVCTGGMSVDPDDRTPLSIRNATDEVITYGAPVLPGAMFMLAYKGEIPVAGLPGCVMYARRTIFDLVLPRIAAGERLSVEDFYSAWRRRTLPELRSMYLSEIVDLENNKMKENWGMNSFYVNLQAELADEKEELWAQTRIDGAEAGKKILLKGEPKDTDSVFVDEKGERIFQERISRPAKLVICGAGHVSMPIIRMGKMLGFHVTVVEDRPKFADDARRAEADQVYCEPFEDGLAKIKGDTDTWFVIVTRGHRYDTDCLRTILGKPRAYVGMMGSKRRTEIVKDQLEAEGVERDMLEAVHTPIGLKIAAETPEEIAVSIMAEIIQIEKQPCKERRIFQ